MLVVLIASAVLAVAAGIVVWTGLREVRTDKAVAKTADWLESEATIHSAAVERLDKKTWYPGIAFSYSARSEYFSGKFFLKAEPEQFDEVERAIIGTKFTLQYDPAHPSAWYIPEATIAGFEIIQKLNSDYPSDTGLYRGEDDQPLGLHLDQ